jgi:hypothetical protein
MAPVLCSTALLRQIEPFVASSITWERVFLTTCNATFSCFAAVFALSSASLGTKMYTKTRETLYMFRERSEQAAKAESILGSLLISPVAFPSNSI